MYSYNSVGQLLSEDGPWDNDSVSYGYTNRLRASLSILAPSGSPWSEAYGYDAAKRLASVSSPAGTFAYSYDSSRKLNVNRLLLPNSAYITNSFDGLGRLVATILKNSGNTILNSHGYAYDLASERTAMTNTMGDYRSYTYDRMGQLKTAFGMESGGSTSRLQEQLGYSYDRAGNLAFRTNNALTQTFTVNGLNELASVGRSGTFTVAGTTTTNATSVTVNGSAANRYGDTTFALGGFTLTNGNNPYTAIAQDALGHHDTNSIAVNLPSSISYTYDLNGNLTSDGTRWFAYDDENQLVSVWVTNAWRSDSVYDGLMRRRIRRNWTWAGGWVETNEVRYIYDGNVPIQERDVYNQPTVTYTRGKDLSGTMHAAGGIGGLLARTDNRLLTANDSSAHAYYHADGNGNITALLNTNQVVVARYLYDAFGNTLSQTGPFANANRYRFSSKEFDGLSAEYYYGYRFYEPNLQRWVNRDPLANGGPPPMGVRLPARLKRQPWEAFEGPNLYTYVHNNPVDAVDANGLWTFGLGLGGLFELIGAFGYDVGIFVGRNPDNGKWSFGVEAGPSVGAGGPGDMGIGGFVQWTNAKRVCDLKGFSFKVGGSVGPRPIQPWAITADGLVGLDSSGISYKGMEIGVAASEGFPLGGHALVNWTWGWDTDSGLK